MGPEIAGSAKGGRKLLSGPGRQHQEKAFVLAIDAQPEETSSHMDRILGSAGLAKTAGYVTTMDNHSLLLAIP